MIDIQKLEELAKAATQGQWRHGKSSDCVVADHPAGHEQDPHGIDYYGGHLVAESISASNRDFIAAASPAAVLELIAEAKRVPVLKDMLERQRSAVTTLIHLGYTDKGGEQWIPPLGKKPDFDLIDSLRTENEKIKAQLADEVMQGYAGAFYKMAQALGITGPRAASPQQVFETEVMPALLALIADRERLAADNKALAEDPGSAL